MLESHERLTRTLTLAKRQRLAGIARALEHGGFHRLAPGEIAVDDSLDESIEARLLEDIAAGRKCDHASASNSAPRARASDTEIGYSLGAEIHRAALLLECVLNSIRECAIRRIVLHLDELI